RRVGQPTELPLVRPLEVTRGETKVRVWSDAGPLPAPAPAAFGVRGGWTEQNIEAVPGKSRLPVLVLYAGRADQPLSLLLTSQEPTLPALIERVLVRAEVAANGVQTYRVSYRLAGLATRQLELDLPAPAPTINLQVALDLPSSG